MPYLSLLSFLCLFINLVLFDLSNSIVFNTSFHKTARIPPPFDNTSLQPNQTVSGFHYGIQITKPTGRHWKYKEARGQKPKSQPQQKYVNSHKHN